MEKKEFVIIRTESAGVHFGYLNDVELMNGFYAVKLEESRRIWSWSGANDLNDLGVNGSSLPLECKVSAPLPLNRLMAIEIISCTEKGKTNLLNIPNWDFNK